MSTHNIYFSGEIRKISGLFYKKKQQKTIFSGAIYGTDLNPYMSCVGKNITLSCDLKLLVSSCITSNRKLKSEVTGHHTRLYLYLYIVLACLDVYEYLYFVLLCNEYAIYFLHRECTLSFQ